MPHENRTATLVKSPLDWSRGDAELFRLSPPLDTGVALPISISDYRNSETMAFPADEDGNVTDWGEVGFVPHKSIEDCLTDMGYEVRR